MVETHTLEKKVFFLNPPPVLSEVVDELAQREFEVYLVRDHLRLRAVLRADPEALVFINIDEGYTEESWLEYIDELQHDPATASVRVGIITFNDRPPEIKQKYFIDHHIVCGFVVLKIGSAKTVEILAKTLEANEARGRRRFVRAVCPPGTSTCVIKLEGALVKAEISDLSSAGMAICIAGGVVLKPGTVLNELTMNIKGARLSPPGFIVGTHIDGLGRKVHVVMFAPDSLDEERREKLKSLVRLVNQTAMDEALARTPPGP